jgi:hypothetical protein
LPFAGVNAAGLLVAIRHSVFSRFGLRIPVIFVAIMSSAAAFEKKDSQHRVHCLETPPTRGKVKHITWDALCNVQNTSGKRAFSKSCMA